MRKNNETEYKYFQFPLCFLQNVLIEPKTGFNGIIDYSIVNFAKKTNYDISDVARQLIYDYYHNESTIESILLKNLRDYVISGEITEDEDYNGFASDGTFESDENIEKLNTIFSNDKDFEQRAILHYQIHCDTDTLNVSLGSIGATIVGYEQAKSQIEVHQAQYGNDPYPGIKTSLLFDIRDKNDRNEMEMFCALIAIKSLIGQRNFTATYKSVIVMRMIGAKSGEVLKECLKKKELKAVYNKYSNRYQIDKLIAKLVSRKFISKISFHRQIFFSSKLDMQELEHAIIEYRRNKDIKRREREARQRISEAIKN